MLDVTATRSLHLQRFGQAPDVFTAPGRVNIIGEHTDYADGFVMPAAIDFATLAAISPRTDNAIVIRSINFDEEVTYPLNSLPAKASHQWFDYPLGVLSVLREAGVSIPANALIGVKSKPPENTVINEGDTWFGSPPIKLPVRQKFDVGNATWTYEAPRWKKFARAAFEAVTISLEVAAGSVLPGLGRIEAVKRQNGQWVVVTGHGLIIGP